MTSIGERVGAPLRRQDEPSHRLPDGQQIDSDSGDGQGQDSEPDADHSEGYALMGRADGSAAHHIVGEFEPVIWQSAATIGRRRLGRGAPACRG